MKFHTQQAFGRFFGLQVFLACFQARVVRLLMMVIQKEFPQQFTDANKNFAFDISNNKAPKHQPSAHSNITAYYSEVFIKYPYSQTVSATQILERSSLLSYFPLPLGKNCLLLSLMFDISEILYMFLQLELLESAQSLPLPIK